MTYYGKFGMYHMDVVISLILIKVKNKANKRANYLRIYYN